MSGINKEISLAFVACNLPRANEKINSVLREEGSAVSANARECRFPCAFKMKSCFRRVEISRQHCYVIVVTRARERAAQMDPLNEKSFWPYRRMNLPRPGDLLTIFLDSFLPTDNLRGICKNKIREIFKRPRNGTTDACRNL